MMIVLTMLHAITGNVSTLVLEVSLVRLWHPVKSADMKQFALVLMDTMVLLLQNADPVSISTMC